MQRLVILIRYISLRDSNCSLKFAFAYTLNQRYLSIMSVFGGGIIRVSRSAVDDRFNCCQRVPEICRWPAPAHHPLGCARAFGALLVVPGKGEHGGRYGKLAAELAGCGWRTWGLDPRGQGLSDGPRSQIESYDEFLADTGTALEALGRECPGRPVVVLGYSMGAVTGVLAALRWPDRVQGLICVSPAFVIDNRLRGLAKVFAYLGSWLFAQSIVASGYNPTAVTNCPWSNSGLPPIR